MAETVRVEGLQETNRDLERFGDAVDNLSEIPSEVSRVRAGRGRVTATRLGPVAEFSYPTRNLRPSRFISAATEAIEQRAPDLIEDAINKEIRKRDLS